jgi:hypothetical protein
MRSTDPRWREAIDAAVAAETQPTPALAERVAGLTAPALSRTDREIRSRPRK